MNKKTSLIIAFLLFLQLVGISSADPPIDNPQFSEPESTNAMTIVYPKTLVYPEDSRILLQFDVLNSTYARRTNTTATCIYVVINELGSVVKGGNLTYNTTLQYWHITLDETQTAESFVYNYYVYCSDNLENGFVSNSYQVTPDGHVYSDHSTSIGFMILVIGIVMALLFLSTQIDTNADWLQAIKLLINIISLFILVGGSAYYVRYLRVVNMNSDIVGISGIIYVALLFVVIPLLLIFLLMFVKELLEFLESLSKTKFKE